MAEVLPGAEQPKLHYEAQILVRESDRPLPGFDEKRPGRPAPGLDANIVGGSMVVAQVAVIVVLVLLGSVWGIAAAASWPPVAFCLWLWRARRAPEDPEAPVAGVRATTEAATLAQGIVALHGPLAEKWNMLVSSAASMAEQGHEL